MEKVKKIKYEKCCVCNKRLGKFIQISQYKKKAHFCFECIVAGIINVCK